MKVFCDACRLKSRRSATNIGARVNKRTGEPEFFFLCDKCNQRAKSGDTEIHRQIDQQLAQREATERK